MNDQQHLTDEQFDELARDAGAELRRAAPADGVRAVRAARRRQQQTRAAVGGTALAAIVALGAVIVLGDDPATVIVQPVDTTPGTAPVTAPASAPVTAPIELVTGLSAEATAWRDARFADGYTSVDISEGQGTETRMLVAQRPEPQSTAWALLLEDGRVIEAYPDGIESPGFGELFSVGGLPALLDLGPQGDGAGMEVWRFDTATGEWSTTGDLGLGLLDRETTPTIRPYAVTVVGERMLVGVNSFVDRGDGTQVPAPDRRGVVVQPDLSVTSIASPPEGVAMSWSSAAGGKALQIFGPNLGSIGNAPYEQPWAYDPAANAWSEIALPDWFDCPTSGPFECQWITSYDGGNVFEMVTGRGVLVGVPDGTLGLYDPTSNAWTQVDAPFDVQGWWSAVDLGERVVVAPGRSFAGGFDTIGVLDLASGTWTTTEVDIPAAIQERIDNEWFDVAWDLRTTGTRVIAVPGPANGASDEAPITVYDITTGAWSTPTPADLVNWELLATNQAR